MTFNFRLVNKFNDAMLCDRYESLLVQVITESIPGLVLAGLAPSQWETALLYNDVSRWLGANLESALYI